MFCINNSQLHDQLSLHLKSHNDHLRNFQVGLTDINIIIIIIVIIIIIYLFFDWLGFVGVQLV